MTVLRSREIVPNIKSQSQPKTVEDGLISIGPSTPLKTLGKPSNIPSYNSTPSSSPLVQSAVGSYSGTVRRRSLRLASKSGSNEINRNSLVSGRKKKSTIIKVNTDLGLCDTESKACDFEVDDNTLVSGQLGTGVDHKEKSVADLKLVLMLNEDLLVSGMEGELGSDLGSLKQSVQRVATTKKGKGKRKLGPEFESIREGETNEGCLRLQLGKKIVTGRVGRGYFGVESAGGDESDHDNAKGDEISEMAKVLNGSREFTALKVPLQEPAVDEKDCIQGYRRFSRKMKLLDKTLTINSVDCVNLESDTKLDSSIGFVVSDAAPFTWGLDKKGLDNDTSDDDNDNGVEHSRGGLGKEAKEKGNVVENALLSSCFDAMELDSPNVEKSDELDNGPKIDTSGTYNKAKKRLSREVKGKEKVHANSLLSNFVYASELDLSEVEKSIELENCPSADTNGIGNNGSRRLSREEKRKAKVVENVVKLDLAKVEKSNNDNVAVQDDGRINVTRTRERFRNIARRNASKFAHFTSNEEEDEHIVDEAEREMPPGEVGKESEDWPGPFSTAMKIINDREINGSVQQQNSSLDKGKSAPVMWVPKKDHNRNSMKLLVPSLQDLCMTILTKNADAITSLDCVPDVLRHKLSHKLCDSRRMNNHFLDLLVRGSPTEIRIRDCSWLTEEHFTSTFEGTDINKLSVLQLDQCGRCLPDYILFATLARSSNILPVLTTISLKGACRLSDVGLSSLLSSAPALRSINLGQCSLLTSVGISSIADSLGSVLRELYLDDCQSIDAILILPALSKLEHLEVLSLAGLPTVCDDFVCQFVSVRGHNLKELVLADCMNLTDYSLKVISETCSGLCALDLTNLCKLTDSAIGYLANGCQSIQSFKLRRNAFSDEAMAAYLETCGESLEELSLNNVNKVAHNTAISLSRHSRNLQSLDISWCRNLTNEAVGLIVDSCLSLKMLKLFGCTQITNVFLDGHSNAQVLVIGLQMSPILEHIKVPDLVGPLHYSSVSP